VEKGSEHARDGYHGRAGRSVEEEVIPGGDDHKQAHKRVMTPVSRRRATPGCGALVWPGR
jgi:hypothetical protein